jgi:hypothetical protein
MPRPRVPRHLAVCLAGMLFVSCADPMGMCGCPPSRSEAVLYGRVTDAAGAPVQGARVSADLGHGGCGGDMLELLAVEPTGADGRYRAHLYSVGQPRPGDCLRAWAAPSAAGTQRGSDTVPFAVRFGVDEVVDSARVDLVLRAP